MNLHDHEMRKKLQELESIEVQLAQHAKTTRLALIWLAIVALAALVVSGYHVVSF